MSWLDELEARLEQQLGEPGDRSLAQVLAANAIKGAPIQLLQLGDQALAHLTHGSPLLLSTHGFVASA